MTVAAEEGGYGKVTLLDEGAYNEMDVCLMFVTFKYALNCMDSLNAISKRCHPAPGPHASVSLSGSLALVQFEIEYFGHSYANSSL